MPGPLPFSQLSPERFEVLCQWLLTEEGIADLELLGGGSAQGGVDLVGTREGRQIGIQCRRTRRLQPRHVEAVIYEIKRASFVEPLSEILIVTTAKNVSKETRDRAALIWNREGPCRIWNLAELDQRAKKHPDLIAEFFPGFSRTSRQRAPQREPDYLEEHAVRVRLEPEREARYRAVSEEMRGYLDLLLEVAVLGAAGFMPLYVSMLFSDSRPEILENVLYSGSTAAPLLLMLAGLLITGVSVFVPTSLFYRAVEPGLLRLVGQYKPPTEDDQRKIRSLFFVSVALLLAGHVIYLVSDLSYPSSLILPTALLGFSVLSQATGEKRQARRD